MILKKLKNAIKLLIIIFLKYVTYRFERIIKDTQYLDITDYKLIVRIYPKVTIEEMSLIFKIMGPDVDICHKTVSKRGYTHKEANKMLEDLKKALPKLELCIVAMIKPRVH